MASIYDIAKRAGVSAATVSRALSDNHQVSEKSKQRIKKIAEEMGYRPNLIARNLRQKSTSMIGLLLDNISDEFSGMIAKGVEDQMKEYNRFVVIWNAEKDQASEQMALNFFSELQLDGVIMADTWVHSVEEMPGFTKPIVFINRMHVNQRVNYVGPDDFHGAFEATQYLIGLGHEQIAYIHGPSDWYASLERLEGYQSALKEANLPYVSEWVAHAEDWNQEFGYECALQLLRSDPKPTAIFAASDMLAIGVLQAAKDLDIHVPTELSVMGYDNRMICQYSYPKLTTISLPEYEVGKKASEVLHQMIKSKDDHTQFYAHYKIKGSIYERESTGPPPTG